MSIRELWIREIVCIVSRCKTAPSGAAADASNVGVLILIYKCNWFLTCFRKFQFIFLFRFLSSVTSSKANTFSSSKHEYINSGATNQSQVVANVNAGRLSNSSNFSTHSGKHKLPMQLNRTPATSSIGVSVITPLAPVQSNRKELRYKQQEFETLQHAVTIWFHDFFKRTSTNEYGF